MLWGANEHVVQAWEGDNGGDDLVALATGAVDEVANIVALLRAAKGLTDSSSSDYS